MQLTNVHIINAPAADVWDLMGERFADIGDWSDTVEASSLDGPLGTGATRTCKLKPTPAGLDTIEETLTAFDRNRQHFAFEIHEACIECLDYRGSRCRADQGNQHADDRGRVVDASNAADDWSPVPEHHQDVHRRDRGGRPQTNAGC